MSTGVSQQLFTTLSILVGTPLARQQTGPKAQYVVLLQDFCCSALTMLLLVHSLESPSNFSPLLSEEQVC